MNPLEVTPGGKEPGTRFVCEEPKWLYALAATSGLLCCGISLFVILFML